MFYGISFMLLDVSRILKFHSALHYYGYFVLAGSLIFFKYSGIIPFCSKLEALTTFKSDAKKRD